MPGVVGSIEDLPIAQFLPTRVAVALLRIWRRRRLDGRREDRRPGSRINGAAVIREMLWSSLTGAQDRPGLYFFHYCQHVKRTFPLLLESPKLDGDVDTNGEDHPLGYLIVIVHTRSDTCLLTLDFLGLAGEGREQPLTYLN